MATQVRMPALGESITEGTITRWLKQEGDQVEADEPLFEVSTDKVDTEVPAPVSGVLRQIKAGEDEIVQVGDEVAVIAGADEAGGEEPEPEPEAQPEARSEVEAEPEAEPEEAGEVTAVTMPALGESITEGTITRWLKQEGDQVEADEPLFEVSTDKVDTEVPAPVSGVLRQIKAGEDEIVQVGDEVAVIGGSGGGSAGTRQAPAEPEPEPARAPEAEADIDAEPDDGDGESGDDAVVSPLVRRLVREHGIDLRKVRGTGPQGRVRRQDVLAVIDGDGNGGARAQPQPQPASEPGQPAAPAGQQPAVPLPGGVREEVRKASRLRRIFAERMVASQQTSAHLTTAVEIDMTKVMRLRARYKDSFEAREGIGLSPLPFSVLALVAAIREYPDFNAALDEDYNLHIYQDVHLGVAVDTPKGLFVPVVRGVDRMNLAGIARSIADVAARTRDNKLDPDELAGSTITLTNTGSVGAVWDMPIINQPNVCIFATPAIVKRPVVVDHPELGEVIAVRHMQYGILTYDHRIIDGADAARFLGRIKQVLEEADFAGELEGYEEADGG